MECPMELQKANWMACQRMSEEEAIGSLRGKSDRLSEGLEAGCFMECPMELQKANWTACQRMSKEEAVGFLLGKWGGLSESL
jgi:hypothetical protein